MQRLFVFFCVLTVVVFSGISEGADAVAAATSKGKQKAGAFTLSNLQGEKVRLEDIKAKVIVIDFWAVWCKTCKEAFPALNELQKKYGPQGLQVVGINLDKQSPQKIAGFVKKAQIEYTVLLDPKGESTKSYDVKGVPTLVLVDQKRNIVEWFRGYTESEGKKIEAEIERLLK